MTDHDTRVQEILDSVPDTEAATYEEMAEALRQSPFLQNVAREFDALQRWKGEATEVIRIWDGCYDDLMSWGVEPVLGIVKASFVRQWIRNTLMAQEVT